MKLKEYIRKIYNRFLCKKPRREIWGKEFNGKSGKEESRVRFHTLDTTEDAEDADPNRKYWAVFSILAFIMGLTSFLITVFRLLNAR